MGREAPRSETTTLATKIGCGFAALGEIDMKKSISLWFAFSLAISTFAGSTRPNILFLLTDDQRPDTLTCYDETCPLPTPNIDRLAQEGVRFVNGFVTTPICAVSRASILTGRYACNINVTAFHGAGARMSAEVVRDSYNAQLRAAGYFTGQLGKLHGYGPEITKVIDVYESKHNDSAEVDGRRVHHAEAMTMLTEDFLDQVPDGKPFCLQVNYTQPHASSCPAPEDDQLLGDYSFPRHQLDNAEAAAKVPPFIRGSFLNVCYERAFNENGDHNVFARQYFEKVASADRSVGKILEMLEKRGVADNTVILFSSDHGAHFGDKHFYGKWSPYDPSLLVPFIIYDPRDGAARGTVRDEMVLSLDIAPTILDYAGVDVPKVMDGKSLVPLISSDAGGEGSTAERSETGCPQGSSEAAKLATKLATKKVEAWRDHFFFEHYHSTGRGSYIARNEGIRTLDEKYCRWIDPPEPIEEFYNLKRDPLEVENLIANPESAGRVKKLRDQFDAWRAAHPANYAYTPHKKHPFTSSFAPEIDWEEFKAARPEARVFLCTVLFYLFVFFPPDCTYSYINSSLSETLNYRF